MKVLRLEGTNEHMNGKLRVSRDGPLASPANGHVEIYRPRSHHDHDFGGISTFLFPCEIRVALSLSSVLISTGFIPPPL